ncbi:hypothetical protein CBOM_03364 [Ceraceosorus bombacis]|uniref:CinA C-terminal domain-containing protein n=1 Tax=Ceraceosorus bombacis TaxID=401625 RepID=A0A0P1BN59_9BASI|nr:hypothetical protein CBOM_03364 [Ceraceosorus bombacis]
MSTVGNVPQELLDRIVQGLKSLGDKTVAVGESSSGGLISAALLGVDGAGAWYKGGGVLYTKESRVSWAGWTEADLRNYRGPTDAVVSGLAESVAKQLGADYAVGESGIAGPHGIGRRLPAGFTCVAVSRPQGRAFTRVIRTGSEDRVQNMHRFALEGLTLLAEVLESDLKDAQGGVRSKL